MLYKRYRFDEHELKWKQADFNSLFCFFPVLFDGHGHLICLLCHQSAQSIVFRRKLEKIAESDFPKLELVHVLENPAEEWSGERGFVDREKIQRLCGKRLKNAGFYVCGPRVCWKRSLAT